RRPVLVPSRKVTSLGSAIFAFLAAGTFTSVEEAQEKICPPHVVYEPQEETQNVYNDLYNLYRRLYFDFGRAGKDSTFGDVLPSLTRIAKRTSSGAEENSHLQSQSLKA
ncbi:MAG: ribulokinase, partial [Candidatus Acidiferrales bacterium]